MNRHTTQGTIRMDTSTPRGGLPPPLVTDRA